MKLILNMPSPALPPDCAFPSASLPPLQTVEQVDLSRYTGDVTAHISCFVEKGKVAITDRSELCRDRKIENTFIFRKGMLQRATTQDQATSRAGNAPLLS